MNGVALVDRDAEAELNSKLILFKYSFGSKTKPQKLANSNVSSKKRGDKLELKTTSKQMKPER